MSELWICDLGVVPYADALELQEGLRAARQDRAIPDVLLLLEHPPVYTRGRRTRDGELQFGEQWYAQRGIEIVDTRRGGRVTYHGPGQLVGYAIAQIDDIVAFVRLIERAAVDALAAAGIAARARPDEGADYTGVWVADRKIASIGLHVSRGVSAHGIAINADNDLAPFGWVVACGLPDVQMTSVTAETGRADTLPGLRDAFASAFAAQLGADARVVDPAFLHGVLAGAR
jgi:lipoyl(octanoyl) transferase